MRIGVKFSRLGMTKFISHLDVQVGKYSNGPGI